MRRCRSAGLLLRSREPLATRLRTKTPTGCSASTSPKGKTSRSTRPASLEFVSDQMNQPPRKTLDWTPQPSASAKLPSVPPNGRVATTDDRRAHSASNVTVNRRWRWRWDLNPRRSCPLTRFRGVLLWPLGHSTADEPTDCRPRARSEPVTQQRAALVREHAGDDLGPVVEPSVPYDVPQRAHGAGLGVVGAVDDARDPGQHRRARAHRARLQRDDEGAAVEPPPAPTTAAAARSASSSACAVGSRSASRRL